MATKRQPLTHFLCIPLLSPATRPQFEAASASFRERLRSLPSPLDADILGRAIRPTGTIHLTLGVMSLKNADRVQEAVKFLDDLNLKGFTAEGQAQGGQVSLQADDTKRAESDGIVLSEGDTSNKAAKSMSLTKTHKQFTINMSSPKSMKNASQTSILYAEPIDASNMLIPFCEQLRAKFVEAGYINEENRPLKLHVTILNTIYASSKGRKGSRNKRPMLIDAKELIQQCEDLMWAEDVVLEKVAICEMGAKMIKDEEGKIVDERYTEIASKQLSL